MTNLSLVFIWIEIGIKVFLVIIMLIMIWRLMKMKIRMTDWLNLNFKNRAEGFILIICRFIGNVRFIIDRSRVVISWWNLIDFMIDYLIDRSGLVVINTIFGCRIIQKLIKFIIIDHIKMLLVVIDIILIELKLVFNKLFISYCFPQIYYLLLKQLIIILLFLYFNIKLLFTV